MTDLDELERLQAEAMRSPTNTDGVRCDWRAHAGSELGSCVVSAHGYTICGPIAGESARYMCALHNALPGLIAELRALREVAQVACGFSEWTDRAGDRKALTAALAKVPK